jgi:tetratricopeptide (TPR) repeat protein
MIAAGLAGAVVLATAAGVYLSRGGGRSPKARAEAAVKAKDWETALALWRKVNASAEASGEAFFQEGRACLALGRAAQAEDVLRRAVAAEPEDARAWQLLAMIYRFEDRQIDSMNLLRKALESIAPADRANLLLEVTMTILTDLPDDVARSTLQRWLAADPADVEAEAALLRRIGSDPRSEDPDRQARLDRLEELNARHPDRPNVREALAITLADGRDDNDFRAVLDSWPADARDARYWRLKGRLYLDVDRRPEPAADAYRRSLAETPHDWRSHYGLARALMQLNRPEEAANEARTVSRIREAIDPLTLGPSLDAIVTHLDREAARASFADLCARVGLDRLAQAWRSAPAPAPAPAPASSPDPAARPMP